MYRMHSQMINRLHDGHLELLRTTNIINQRFIQMIERREMRENSDAFGLQSPRDNLNSDTPSQTQTNTQTNNTFTSANTNPTFSTGLPRRNRNVNGRMATQPRTTRRRPVTQQRTTIPDATTYMFSWGLNNPDNVQMSQFPVNNAMAETSSAFPANLVRPIRTHTLNRSTIPNIFQELMNVIPNNAREMTDVPIPVDADTIERVTETLVFDVDSSDNSIPDNCPIDLSPFEANDEIMKIQQCGHCFRKSSLLRWFESNPRCPICRLDVRENRENTTNDLSDLSGNLPSQTVDNSAQEQLPLQATNQTNINTRVNQEVQNAIHQVFDELFPNTNWNL